MSTYCFTIADGAVYQMHAERLRRSLEACGMPLVILESNSSNSMEAKHRKISGILEAPRTYDRIMYLDADTLVLDLEEIETVNGAWRIPWRIPVENCLPKQLDPGSTVERLESFYHRHNLPAFASGGDLEGIEWNSGVILGERDLMVELAQEWALWWDRILALFDGHFRRDQLSFRIAYYNVCLAGNIEGLPADYNWIASYFGINPNVHILHRTMVRRVSWLEEEWERIVTRRLAGEDVRTANRCFDYNRSDRPCLQCQTNVDPEAEADLLRQTLAFGQPKSILLYGIDEDDQRFLPLIRACSIVYKCAPALAPALPQLAGFDLVVFCGVNYVIPDVPVNELNHDTVFCFAGIHDMASYQYLYEFPYVRIIDHGFGVFSHASRIMTWNYTRCVRGVAS